MTSIFFPVSTGTGVIREYWRPSTAPCAHAIGVSEAMNSNPVSRDSANLPIFPTSILATSIVMPPPGARGFNVTKRPLVPFRRPRVPLAGRTGHESELDHRDIEALLGQFVLDPVELVGVVIGPQAHAIADALVRQHALLHLRLPAGERELCFQVLRIGLRCEGPGLQPEVIAGASGFGCRLGHRHFGRRALRFLVLGLIDE